MQISSGGSGGSGSSSTTQLPLGNYNDNTNTNTTIITRATTLLLDDDVNNICIALKNSTRAIHCDPDKNRNMIDDLLAVM